MTDGYHLFMKNSEKIYAETILHGLSILNYKIIVIQTLLDKKFRCAKNIYLTIDLN